MRKSAPVVVTVLATAAHVREVEPNGAVLHNVRFVGKEFVPPVGDETQGTWEPLPEGVTLSLRGRQVEHIKKALKHGDLLPLDTATALWAGISAKGLV